MEVKKNIGKPKKWQIKIVLLVLNKKEEKKKSNKSQLREAGKLNTRKRVGNKSYISIIRNK